MYFKVNSFLLIQLILFVQCTAKQKTTEIPKNNEVIKCAVIDEDSELWNKRTNLGPTGKDADESLFVIKELKKRIDNPTIQIARRPHHLANEIILFSPIETSTIERISCILRAIMEEYNTKPIAINIEELQEVKNEKTGQLEKRRVKVQGHVVE